MKQGNSYVIRLRKKER